MPAPRQRLEPARLPRVPAQARPLSGGRPASARAGRGAGACQRADHGVVLLPRRRVSGAAIVCLSGLGGSADDLVDVGRQLAGRGRVAMAMPPEGEAVVIGHSQGALRALELAAADPDRVVALVLAGAVFPPARNGRTLAASAADYARRRARYL